MTWNQNDACPLESSIIEGSSGHASFVGYANIPCSHIVVLWPLVVGGLIGEVYHSEYDSSTRAL